MAHRIYVLTLDRILDREISQTDLLNGSISLDLSPDLLDSPSIMLLSSPKLTSVQTNPAPDDNPVDEDEPVDELMTAGQSILEGLAGEEVREATHLR